MNVTYPETIWEYSPETEVQRIFFVARLIQSYFYQVKGFLVLPEISSKTPSAIYFPNLPIVHHPHFWERVRETGIYESAVPAEIMNKVKNELGKNNHVPTKIRKDWERKAPIFWRYLQKFIPETTEGIRKLVIRQTQFGSTASSVRTTLKEPGILTIYIRFDANISSIPAAIFIGTLDKLLKTGQDHSFRWEERQAIGDFLLQHTALTKTFPGCGSTILELRQEIQQNLRQESNEYLSLLGFPPKKLFQLNEEGFVTINNQCLPLRPKEHDVLTLLIEKRNNIVSVEDIAERLWSQDSKRKFSLYAISKIVERLRKQVRASGVYPGVIETHRGVGFLLND